MKKTATILSTDKTADPIMHKLYPTHSRALALLAALFSLLSAGHASAAGALWNDSAADNNWFTAANWTPVGVPNSSSSIVSIDLSESHSALIYNGTAAAGDLVVGNVSNGTLSLGGVSGVNASMNGFDGGTLNVTNTLTLGLYAPSNGNLYVLNGSAGGVPGDSVLTVGGALAIGGTGSGTLTVNATSSVSDSTAIVNAQGGLILDAKADQTAALVVSGDKASVVVTGGNLIVGNTSTGTNTVTITLGGTLDDSAATYTTEIGEGAGTTGTVNLTTASSTLKSNFLIVGDNGTGNLSISAGAVDVSSAGGAVGYESTGTGTVTITTGGTLTVAGTGSVGGFYVGDFGAGTMYVGTNPTDFATFNTDDLGVGDESVGTVYAEGTHSITNVAGNVYVGTGNGSGNGAINLSDGATMNVNTTGNVDVSEHGATGAITLTSGATLNALTKGSLSSLGTGTFIIGQDFDQAAPGTVTARVTVGMGAADAATVNTDSLVVGKAGVGIFNIGTGAVVNVGTGNVTLGSASTTVSGTTYFGSGTINVNEGGTLNALNGGTVVVGSVGSGLLSVTDGGEVNVTGNVDLNRGAIQVIDPSVMNVTGNVQVAAGTNFYGGGGSILNLGTPLGAPTALSNFLNAGTLTITGSTTIPPSIAPSASTFTINGAYVGQGGTIQFIPLLNGSSTTTGELIVSGGTSGDSLVHIINANGSHGGQTTGDGIELLSTPDSTTGGTFALSNNRVVAGGYDYELFQVNSGPDAGLYLQSHFSPQVMGAMSMAAGQQYLELASIDSLVQREGELEASYQKELKEIPASWSDSSSKTSQTTQTPQAAADPPPSYKTSELWARGIYRNDDLHTSVGLRQDSTVGEIGGDYQFRGLAGGNDRLYVGALADYGGSNGHTTNGNVGVDGTNVGFGLYTTYLNRGFYADALVKGNISHEKINAQDGNLSTNGRGASASIEAGYAYRVGDGYKVEPEGQLIYENETYDHLSDSAGRNYDFHNPNFLQGRLGVRFDKSFEYSKGLYLTPYVRVSGLEQFLGDNQVTVDGTTFDENIGGTSFAFDGGLTADLSDNVGLYLNGNSAWGEKDDSYGATGGVKFAW